MSPLTELESRGKGAGEYMKSVCQSKTRSLPSRGLLVEVRSCGLGVKRARWSGF